jgi:hypothetical protein
VVRYTHRLIRQGIRPTHQNNSLHTHHSGLASLKCAAHVAPCYTTTSITHGHTRVRSLWGVRAAAPPAHASLWSCGPFQPPCRTHWCLRILSGQDMHAARPGEGPCSTFSDGVNIISPHCSQGRHPSDMVSHSSYSPLLLCMADGRRGCAASARGQRGRGRQG